MVPFRYSLALAPPATQPRTWAHDCWETEAFATAVPSRFQGCHQHWETLGQGWDKNQHQGSFGEGGSFIQLYVHSQVASGGCKQEAVDLQHVAWISLQPFTYCPIVMAGNLKIKNCDDWQWFLPVLRLRAPDAFCDVVAAHYDVYPHASSGSQCWIQTQ